MYTLRDGTETEDKRLDRLVLFDEASRRYSIRDILPADAVAPRTHEWRCKTVLNQGRNGACVAFAVAHELIAEPVEVTGVTKRFVVRDIYWEAQKIDPWQGGCYPGAKPRYEGTAVLAGMKAAQRIGAFSGYRWAFGLDDLVVGVGYSGPAVVGLPWYADMEKPNGAGYITPTGKLLGGHCVLCRGVNVERQDFTLRNSWGRRWNHGGDCRISWADMDMLLHQRGEAVFAVERHAVAL